MHRSLDKFCNTLDDFRLRGRMPDSSGPVAGRTPRSGMNTWHFHRDNAESHSGRLTQDLLAMAKFVLTYT